MRPEWYARYAIILKLNAKKNNKIVRFPAKSAVLAA